MKIKGIDPNKVVSVYRNLKHGRKALPLYSVMQGGRIVARLHRVLLAGKWDGDYCKFVVREKGRQRVIKEKRKNVHAFVVGYLVNPAYTPKDTTPGAMGIDENGRDLPARVMYNPYAAGYFFIPNSHTVNG